MNCIVHNDFIYEIPPVFEIFSSRIVMTYYGGLIPGQSIEFFFRCSIMPRKRELMRVFKDVELVEHLSSGMSRILKAYDKDIFQVPEHFIKVFLPYAENVDIKIIATSDEVGDHNGDKIGDDKKVLRLLKEQLSIIAKELSARS